MRPLSFRFQLSFTGAATVASRLSPGRLTNFLVAKMERQGRSSISDRNGSERSLDPDGHLRPWAYFRDAALVWLRGRSRDLFHGGGGETFSGPAHSARQLGRAVPSNRAKAPQKSRRSFRKRARPRFHGRAPRRNTCTAADQRLEGVRWVQHTPLFLAANGTSRKSTRPRLTPSRGASGLLHSPPRGPSSGLRGLQPAFKSASTPQVKLPLTYAQFALRMSGFVLGNASFCR